MLRRDLAIPLADGAELRANLVLPDDSGQYPALVYYVPYHKDDFVGANFEHPLSYFAEHGYASLLVDARGTGSSTGRAWTPFDSASESLDGCETVEWAAAQPWCNGTVGMWGVSYGGFTALHTAARQPPHLKAIATVFGIQDPYRDFVAPGGIPNLLGNWMRETHMVTMDLAPPAFHDTEGRWRQVWLDRISAYRESGPRSFEWHAHPSYDAFWQRLSIPVESIEAATFVMGGWRDLFAPGMIRTYERLHCRKRLLMGPWTHVHPYLAPEQPIDWLDELRCWWDETLNGGLTGARDRATVYVGGRRTWVRGQEWPGRTSIRELTLAGTEVRYEVDPRTGVMAGLWDPLGSGVGAPQEQSHDDARSWTATGDTLTEPLRLSGRARVRLCLARVDGRDTQLVVKLNDVDPSGRSELVSTGYLPTLEGRFPTTVEVDLAPASHEFLVGHRLRLSVSGSDFPRVWPSASNSVIWFESTAVELRIEAANGKFLEVPPPPAPAAGPKIPQLVGTSPHWRWEEDPLRGRVHVETSNLRSYRLRDGTTYRIFHRARAYVSRDAPSAARLTTSARIEVELPDGGSVGVSARGHFKRARARLRALVTEKGRTLLEGDWMREADDHAR